MEFISAKKFKDIPKTVQNVFLECWKPSVGDLYTTREAHKDMHPVKCAKRSEDDLIIEINSYIWEVKSDCIPLLTQSQLIQFIENHNYCIDIESYHGYQVTLKKRIAEGKLVIESRVSSGWLLDLIWEMALNVAFEIAKEENSDGK